MNAVSRSRRKFMQRIGLGAVGLGASSFIACAASAKENSDADGFAITHGPVLQSPGSGEVVVTWHTNRPAVSRVLFGQGGALDCTAVTSRDGLIPNDSTCHAIRLTGLMPGQSFQYKLISREFRGYATPYLPRFGESVESDTYTATGISAEKKSFSFLMWNDIHDDANRLKAMFDDVPWEGVDFVVLNGDIINDFVREEQFFKAFYDVCAQRFAAAIPIVFVRGNHETRGAWARRFSDYVPGVAGRPYYSFDHGGVHFIALDSGEDKPDDHKEYAGLVEFSSFRKEQTRWLQADLESDASKKARYRIILSHQPMTPVGTECFGAQEVRRLWRPLVNQAGAHLWLSGHTHSFTWVKPGEDGDNVFHAMTNPQDATTQVEVTPDALCVSVIRQGGKVIHTETLL